MATLVTFDQRRDFKVPGFKSRAKWIWNRNEKISCYSTPCKIDDLWNVKSTRTSASCYIFSLVQTVLQSHACNRPGKQKPYSSTWHRKAFSQKDEDNWSFIQSVKLMEQTWTLHWQAYTTHTVLSIWEPLYKGTGGHLKQVRCVFKCDSVHARFKAISSLNESASKW